MKEELIPFDMKTVVTSQAGAVALPAKIMAVTVKNTGNTNLYWDSDLIAPGDFKGFTSNRGELYKGTVSLKYKLPSPAPADPFNEATVSVRFYVEYNP